MDKMLREEWTQMCASSLAMLLDETDPQLLEETSGYLWWWAHALQPTEAARGAVVLMEKSKLSLAETCAILRLRLQPSE